MSSDKNTEKDELQEEVLEHVDLESIMGTSYIDYSMSVIVARAIPDVRDGMKPVQRRIAYSMHQLGLTHNVPYKKCATTVGDVLGHYHPHGDASVYDALAHMAQDFSMRYPLVDGHGNFGSMDGDPPAAYRYTESRMYPILEEMMRDIDKNTIDWTPNYDNSINEPTVLPARLPNLLLNGASGIAVGMACSIPPHNLGEIVDAVLFMIDNDLKNCDTTVDDLLGIVKGPDFPTGALILGDSYKEAYRTGTGKVLLQATHEIETVNKKQNLVFTSIPYQVNKADLVVKIAKYAKEKKLDVADVRDESNHDGVRIVVELKRTAIPEMVLNNLLHHTALRSSYSINMLCIVDRQPKTLNLEQMLRYYLEHQEDVVTRRTVFEKDKAEKRIHIVEGLILATAHIDDIIDLIRSQPDPGAAKQALMDTYGLTEIQAQTILDLRLRTLTGLERQKLEQERADLEKEIARCTKILSDRKELLKVIKKELKDLRKKYADDRRTHHQMNYDDIEIEDLIRDEPCVVIRTNIGYLKRLKSDMFRTQKRGGKGSHVATVQDDYIEDMIFTTTLSDLVFFTNFGRVYTMKAYQIAETSRTARGTALAAILTKLQPGEMVTGMVAEREYADDRFLMVITKRGVVKRMPMSAIKNVHSIGLFLIKLDEGDEVCSTVVVSESDNVMIATKQGYCSGYSVSSVRSMGRQARGMRGIKLSDGDEVIGMMRREDGREVVLITELGYAKRVRCEDFRLFKNRNTRGTRCIKAADNERIGDVIQMLFVEDPADDLIITTDNGQMIRTPLAKVPQYSRQAMGSRMMNLSGNPDGVIAGMVMAVHEEPVEEDEEEP